ncbi:acriflavin resistance protein [Paenibacillus sp. A3]|uniref:efflux RND transporter permease subunit n=1 Tax=Paenibacillus sp. A3 TaxID=1337054 RepID=UPI0006D5929B|nr:efflux RND transporter permease subunit [Paenibacillus sp. A3]KPV57881.1 acriflavin resistance protein [Paenibacillus sp. A3]
MIAKALKYKKITLLFFIMLVFVGFFSLATLKKRENPEITTSVALVKTIYPGASPEKVEQLVTKPLEEAIKEMQHIEKIESTSEVNVSLITVELVPDVDYKKAWDTLRQKVQAARSKLPADAYQSEVDDDLVKTAAQIVHLVIDRPEDMEKLRPVADNWKEQLRTISGVSDVQIAGLPDKEMKVILDKKKLEGFGLPWGVVLQSLTNTHDRIPIGDVKKDNQRIYVQLTGEWKSASDLADTVIFRSPEQGPSVKLKDVAEVKMGTKKVNEQVFYNGKPSVDIVINAEKGVDVPSLQQRIDEETAGLKAQLPSDVAMVSLFTQKESVDKLFSQLSKELIIGMVVVILVCSLGLRLNTAVVVSLAIPISIAIGFLPVMMTLIDLNQITIAALVIVLGILVDDAIVVNDNIERRLQLGDRPYDAALKGSREVGISILTATLATAAAFFPLFFLEGNIGDFVRPIPVVISLTLAASMIMSLTIVPIYRQWSTERQLRRNKSTDYGKPPGLLGGALERLSVFYEKQIRRLLKKPVLTGMTALIIGTSSYGLLPFLGVEYFPSAERSEFLVDVEMPVDSYYEQTVDTMKNLSAWAEQQEGVRAVSAYTGRTAPRFYYSENVSYGTRLGQLFVSLDESKAHTKELVPKWRKQLGQMFPNAGIIIRELEQGVPVGAPIAVRISGSDLLELTSLSQQVQDKLRSIPGAVNVKDDVGAPMPTSDLQLDKDKAQFYGVTEKDLSASMRLATEGVKATDIQIGNKLIDVTLYSEDENVSRYEALEDVLVPSQTGMLYPVKEFVNFERNQMVNAIQHRNLTKTITVKSYADGRLASDIQNDLTKAIKDIHLPDGYKIEYGGEDQERNAAFISIGKLSIIVMLLIYTVIAMQFYSLSTPVLILSTVYLALGGALIGLFVTGAPIGFMALMGLISLSGIVVRNGIVLIEFIEDARKEGVALYDAIAESGRARLRPILLTSAVAIGGMLPMAIMGGSMWRSMAVCIISGLIFSTLLTLIVVPTMYLKLAEWRDRRQKRRAELETTYELGGSQ